MALRFHLCPQAGGHDDDRHRNLRLPQRGEQLLTGHHRHLQVEQNQGRWVVQDVFECLTPVGSSRDGVAISLKDSGDKAADASVIINDEHAGWLWHAWYPAAFVLAYQPVTRLPIPHPS
jgi:hypothetical protein